MLEGWERARARLSGEEEGDMLRRNVQRKLGTSGRMPRLAAGQHSEGGTYNPQSGEVVPCRPVGRMRPIK